MSDTLAIRSLMETNRPFHMEADSSAANPGINVALGEVGGIYRYGANSPGFSANGIESGFIATNSAWTIGPVAGGVTHTFRGSINPTGQVLASAGTAGAPGISFSAATDKGFRGPSGATLYVVTNGADLAQFTSTQLLMGSGNGASPGYAFVADPSYGMGYGANTLFLSSNGVKAAIANSSQGWTLGTTSYPAHVILGATTFGDATFNPSGATVTLKTQGTSNNGAALALFNAGANQSYFGVARTSNDWITSVSTNDTIIRAETHNIVLSVDGGTTAGFSVNTSKVVSTPYLLAAGPGVVSSAALLSISAANTPQTLLALTTQYGASIHANVNSSGTSRSAGIAVDVSTDAAAFTLGHSMGFRYLGLNVGSGSTVTRSSVIFGGIGTSATQSCFASDNEAWTGNYVFNFTSTNPSVFSGPVGIGGANNASYILNVGASNPLTGTSQYGISSAPTLTSAATVDGEAVSGQIRTAASAFTLAYATAFGAQTAILGSGSSITRLMNFSGATPTLGANNAWGTDSSSFTGSYVLFFQSTSPSSFGGTLTAGSFIPTSSTVPTNGMYLPAANRVAFATNSTLALQLFSDQSINFYGSSFSLNAAAVAATNSSVFTGITDGSMSLSGGTGSASGRNVFLYGSTHSTKANYMELRHGSTVDLSVDGSGNLITSSGVATAGYDTSTPTTGGTVTTAANKPGLLMTPAGTLATLTVKLPSSPFDGQQYWVATSQTITAITWQDSGGTAGNVIGGPSSLTSVGVRFVYNLAGTKWYSVG